MNHVAIIGNLGADVRMNFSKGGIAIANFPVATTNRWTDDKGEKHEVTQWHDCVAFGKTAELCGDYLKKGSKIALEGSLTYDTYEKEGVQIKHAKIKISQLHFVEKKSSGEGSGSKALSPPSSSRQPAANVSDDDIPF